MKSIFYACMALTLGYCLVAKGDESSLPNGSIMNKLRIVFSIKKEYALGDPIRINLELQNLSNQRLTVVTGENDPPVEISIIENSGRHVNRLDRDGRGHRMENPSQMRIEFGPKEVKKYTFDVLAAVDEKVKLEPGEYKIRFRLVSVYKTDSGKAEAELISSDTQSFRIVAK